MWLFVSGREEAAVGLYALGAISDFFDGAIARATGSVTELGRLLDPLADRIFIMALALALVARGTMPLWVALVVAGRDVAILALWPYLERRGVQRIRVNFTGKVATAALLAGLTCLAYSETRLPVASAADLPGGILVGTGAVLYWVAAALYGRQALDRIKVAR